MRTRPFVVAALLACAASTFPNCNTRSEPFEQALSTAPSSVVAAGVPGAPVPRLARLDVGSTGGIGPLSGTGTVTLDAAAPEGGVTVSLRSSAPSVVSLSSTQVTVAHGAYTAAFTFSTPPVPADTSAAITASTADRTLSASIGIWAVLPAFYSYAVGQSGLVSETVMVRRTSSNGATFDATCVRNVVTAIVDTFTRLEFAAANGQPLRVGVYENARISGTANNRMPHFLLGQVQNSCAVTGRFEVREAEYAADGLVKKLWISFEQGCAGQQGTVRGDIRTASRPDNPWRNQCVMP